MVFYRLGIRFKATNVVEIESKSIRGSVKTRQLKGVCGVMCGNVM